MVAWVDTDNTVTKLHGYTLLFCLWFAEADSEWDLPTVRDFMLLTVISP